MKGHYALKTRLSSSKDRFFAKSRSRRRGAWAGIVFFLLAAFVARSEVYDLLPALKGGAANWAKALGAKKLWVEPVLIDGVKGELRTEIGDADFPETLKRLRKLYPNRPILVNRHGALLEIPMDNGARRRLYAVGFGENRQTLQFTLTLPRAGTATTAVFWPDHLPLPKDAEPTSSIVLPERHIAYGVCAVKIASEKAVETFGADLEADGWRAVTVPGQNGRVFFSSDMKSVITISASVSEKKSVSSLHIVRARR